MRRKHHPESMRERMVSRGEEDQEEEDSGEIEEEGQALELEVQGRENKRRDIRMFKNFEFLFDSPIEFYVCLSVI